MPWCEKCNDFHLRPQDCLHGDRSLSEGEKEVMALIAEGRNNEFIAKKLYRSMGAIRSRIKSLYFKLDIDGNKYDKRLKLALLGQEQKEVYDGTQNG